MDEDVRDLIFRVMVAFTDSAKRDEFVDGLTPLQYDALRQLNSLRIDSGDDRIPEDYVIRDEEVVER